jgi:hypothetical protein
MCPASAKLPHRTKCIGCIGANNCFHQHNQRWDHQICSQISTKTVEKKVDFIELKTTCKIYWPATMIVPIAYDNNFNGNANLTGKSRDGTGSWRAKVEQTKQIAAESFGKLVLQTMKQETGTDLFLSYGK